MVIIPTKQLMFAYLKICKHKCPEDGFVKFQNTTTGEFTFVPITNDLDLQACVDRYYKVGKIEGIYTADKTRIHVPSGLIAN